MQGFGIVEETLDDDLHLLSVRGWAPLEKPQIQVQGHGGLGNRRERVLGCEVPVGDLIGIPGLVPVEHLVEDEIALPMETVGGGVAAQLEGESFRGLVYSGFGWVHREVAQVIGRIAPVGYLDVDFVLTIGTAIRKEAEDDVLVERVNPSHNIPLV